MTSESMYLSVSLWPQSHIRCMVLCAPSCNTMRLSGSAHAALSKTGPMLSPTTVPGKLLHWLHKNMQARQQHEAKLTWVFDAAEPPDWKNWERLMGLGVGLEPELASLLPLGVGRSNPCQPTSLSKTSGADSHNQNF